MQSMGAVNHRSSMYARCDSFEFLEMILWIPWTSPVEGIIPHLWIGLPRLVSGLATIMSVILSNCQ